VDTVDPVSGARVVASLAIVGGLGRQQRPVVARLEPGSLYRRCAAGSVACQLGLARLGEPTATVGRAVGPLSQMRGTDPVDRLIERGGRARWRLAPTVGGSRGGCGCGGCDDSAVVPADAGWWRRIWSWPLRSDSTDPPVNTACLRAFWLATSRWSSPYGFLKHSRTF